MQTVINFILFLIVTVWIISAPHAGAQQDRIRMEEKIGIAILPAKGACSCVCPK